MRPLTNDELSSIIKQSNISSSLKRKLKVSVDDINWRESNFILIQEKSVSKGVLVYQHGKDYYVLKYALSPLSPSSVTGKKSVIICDFCNTWHGSSSSTGVTFDISRTYSGKTISFLCCQELDCNENVRNKTKIAHLSRAHLRENLSDEERIERFINKLDTLLLTLSPAIRLA